MRLAAISMLASAVLGLGGPALAARHAPPPAPAEPVIAVVSADDEVPPPDDFRATLDRVFGPGRWRQTSGYRSVAQENALRRQGAGTVPAGHVSRHSLGDPEAPGAYDVVVAGMSPAGAAAKLRRDGAAFPKVAAEAAHGGQGPHLHIELASGPGRASSTGAADN
jgi:hypothetical protein